MVAAIKYRVRDYSSSRSAQIAVYVPDSISIENIAGYAKELAPMIDAMSDGYIDKVSAKIRVNLPSGLKPNALAGADLELGAEFMFNPGYQGPRIPAFRRDLFLSYDQRSNELDLDTNDPDVAALIVALVDGLDTTPSGGDQVVKIVDSRGEEFIDLEWTVGSYEKYKR